MRRALVGAITRGVGLLVVIGVVFVGAAVAAMGPPRAAASPGVARGERPPGASGAPGGPPQDPTGEECFLCHAEPDVVEMAEVDPRPGLVVDAATFADSVHADFECSFCHLDTDDVPHAAELPAVDPGVCSDCHADASEAYADSVHGVAFGAGDPDAATCSSCHGAHDIRSVGDPESRVHALALPETCGSCHADQRIAREHAISVPDAYQSFVQGVHGRGLLRAGLLVSASCDDCHGSHAVYPREDERSRIHPRRLPETCGDCHQGLLVEFEESVHGELLVEGDPDAPTCDTCHPAHGFLQQAGDGFAAAASRECGNCHADKLSTYRGTYHGKVNALGYGDVAACSSCHTAHHILPAEHPGSSVAPANLVATCGSCHPGANENFAGYIVHADPTDPDGFPLLFAVYFGMLGLLLVTLAGGTAHTLLWYRRLRVEQRRLGISYERPAYRKPTGEPEYVRFNLFNRILHILVMSSFILLVATGLPVRFPEADWAQAWASFFGGVRGAAVMHRVGAVVMLVYVALHLGYLAWMKLVQGRRGLISGSGSLLPSSRDWEDFVGHVRWFLGKGPRPRFGRWTYWEKFDYLADAWGVLVFGATGLIMWYPVFFTRWLPGWAINVAVIVHGIEALLALSFIFVVHFFNAHLRPGKFPLDPVFLTGRLTLEEFKEERPREYEELARSGDLEGELVEPSSELTRHYARVVGYVALATGLGVVAVVVVTVLRTLFGS